MTCLTDLVTDYMEDVIETPEEIVGYYIEYYGDEAYRQWEENTSYLTYTEKDKMVNKILNELFA